MSELYASALHLDRKAVKALKITDPYSLHRVVFGLFEDVRDEVSKNGHTPNGIVFADQGGDFNTRKILMVSDRRPANMAEGGYGQVIVKSIPPEFLQHTRYRFKVQINPVRKDHQSQKRVAVKGREGIAQWFLERSVKSWGFEADPNQLQVDSIEVKQFKSKNDSTITMGVAHIQGALKVTDPDQFRKSFQNGIGKARAFGCGLLQVVPLLETPLDL